MHPFILADGRWTGKHGIGRFSQEVLSRLTNTTILTDGPSPLSPQNLIWLPIELYKKRRQFSVYFNPGFNPIVCAAIPYVFTIHDLTHLHLPGNHPFLKKIYYETLLKYSAKKARHIITVSEFSKHDIMQWAKIPAEKITVVGNGISNTFQPEGTRYQPGFPYLLHVGNTKAHKNVNRLIEAFAHAKIDSSIHLILTGEQNNELQMLIQKNHLTHRIQFQTGLDDEKLAALYRGATAFILPSLYEGFGIPVIEAMACGTPVITSTVTSLPEVADDAALLVDPNDSESIANGIETIINDKTLRDTFIQKGLERAKFFSWDKTAALIQQVLF